jgi:cobalt/nickel transport system permease protein
MHTPDGFVTGWICVVMLIISILAVLLSVLRLRKDFSKSKAISLATVASVIFLGQMLNFPVLAGTSGHLVGAAFALIILGVEGAVVAMAAVLLVQTLVFGDGGALALGVNIFNMGIVGIYAASFAKEKTKAFGGVISTFSASWVAVMAGAVSASLLLAASGTAEIFAVLSSMAFTHLIIGIGEGFITVVLVSIFANRLVTPSWRVSLATLGVSFLALAILVPFASGEPDGMERVAINLGFFGSQTSVYEAPVPDYAVPALAAVPYFAVVSAALLGTVFTYLVGYSVSRSR